MTFPLYSALIVYGVLFLVFLFFLGVNIYHMRATSTFTPVSVTVLVAVVVLSVVIVGITVYLLKDVAWTMRVVPPFSSSRFEF